MGRCEEATVTPEGGAPAAATAAGAPGGAPFAFTVPPEAPVFAPSVEEFRDPLAYINKIRPVAEKSGICKIKPPANWRPPFAVDVDRLRFTPRIQRLNELEAITRVKLNFLDQIVKFWELQGSLLKIPTVERKPLDLYALHRIVKEAGGFEVCTTERKWSKIAVRMGHPQGKGVGSILKNHYERILYPYDLFRKREDNDKPECKVDVTPEKANISNCKGRGSAQKSTPPSPAIDNKPPTRRWKKYSEQENDPDTETNIEGNEKKKETRKQAASKASSEVEDKKLVLRDSPSKRRAAALAANYPRIASCPSAISLRPMRSTPMKTSSLQVKRQVSMTVNVVPAAPDTDQCAVDPLAKYICHNCGRGDVEEQMLLCDGCDDSYHTFCLMPPLESIPKGDWRCPRCIAQEVSKPTEAFGFEQAQREYTLQQFGEMADQFKSEYFNMPLVPTDTVEKEFWRIVSSIDEDVTVEYGADLHSMDHGSGFPTKSSIQMYPGDQEYADSSWNLNNLPVLEGSVLGHINADISGMKVPWMYVGMCFATFCWHIEDHWSYSINYMHWGEPKTWYGVPGSKAELFETTMRSAAPELFQWQPDLLHQLVTIMNPNILMQAGVPVYRTDQNAGEFVITFPRAYHAGFNQGYNFAEAVNFTPADWLKIGRECIAHYSNLRRFCVFSHDELVCKMALEAETLEATVALGTYQDMRNMLSDERKLRKSLLEWGVTEAEREAFELIPDDERQCSMCKTTCFLSAVTCSCTVNLVCLRHYTSLCDCAPQNHRLRYRYTLDELPLMLEKLKSRSEIFREWADSVSNALDPDTPKSYDLDGLRLLYKRALDLKMHKSDLMRALEIAIEDADKCASVIHQLDLNKMRTRTRHSADLKYRLTVEELTLFCEEIDGLACVLPEGSAVKEVLRQTIELEKSAEALLAIEPGSSGAPARIKELEACADKGSTLCIQLPCLPHVVNRLQQEKFLEEVKIHREDYESLSLEEINRLLDHGVKIQPHFRAEVQLAYLQSLKNEVEKWEKKAKEILSVDSGHQSLEETETLLQETESVEAYLPSKQPLTNAINQAKDWLQKVDEMQSKESYPYFSTLETLVKKGTAIPINLCEKDTLSTALDSAKQWKERTARTFLRKNWNHGLMEALSPRTDILSSTRRPVNNQMSRQTPNSKNTNVSAGSPVVGVPSTLEAENFMKNFSEDHSPTQIVGAFKTAEENELSNMRELRARNLRKDIRVQQPGVTYCHCQKRQYGLMTQCQLCKEWFHAPCINNRNTVNGPPSPPTSSGSMSPDQEPLSPGTPSVNGPGSSRYLCSCCLRTRRPRLDTILGLLVSLQNLPVRLCEGEALQCLTERAMAWQDKARALMRNKEAARALASISHTDLASQPTPRDKQEKNVPKPAKNADPQQKPIVEENPAIETTPNRNSSASEHAYSASPQTLPRNTSPHPNRLRLPLNLLHRFEDLLMEGDLLEVCLKETSLLWNVVKAARDSRELCGVWNERISRTPGSASGRSPGSLPVSLKRSAQVAVSSIHRRNHLKRPRRNKDGIHPSKVLPVKKPRKSPPPTNTPVARRGLSNSASNYLNRKQNLQSVSSGSSLMMKKHYLAKQERRRRSLAAKSTGSPEKPMGRGRRGLHKIKKEKTGEVEGDKSGVTVSPTSEDSSSGNMSSNDDDEDCAAHTCLRPTGKEVDWVQCDGGCEKWFHLHCVGLSKNSLKDDEDYYCLICSGPNGRTRSRDENGTTTREYFKKEPKGTIKRGSTDDKQSLFDMKESLKLELTSKSLNGESGDSTKASPVLDSISRTDENFKMDLSEEEKIKDEIEPVKQTNKL
ncbi:lysine-specific demethylase 5A-like isoform X2 [Arctopsyche grandis]|uniref:lysine-specific demethylase 5A-like isoform X2 n=1 Tax=Arctopsyche grandis TaxID=121162 RepID=UPI00406D97C5